MTDPIMEIIVTYMGEAGKYAMFIGLCSVLIGIVVKAAMGKTRWF